MPFGDTSRFTLEICCTSVSSAILAQEYGADRIELCQNLEQGGTTPSYGTIKATVRRLRIPVHVLIRPRAGHFNYTTLEFEEMIGDIEACAQLGCAGVVVGVTTPADQVDIERTKILVQAAGNMAVTFHRAFDDCLDLSKALEDVMATGCGRLLTSGGAKSAEAGADNLQKLVTQAAGRIKIMAGAGILPSNVRHIVGQTGVREVHTSAKELVTTTHSSTRRGLFDTDEIVVDGQVVYQLTRELTAIDSSGTG